MGDAPIVHGKEANMEGNLHSSLPIEYQLNYGTACGYLDISRFMNKTSINGIRGVDGLLSQEELLRLLGIDSGSILVNRGDPLLIGT
jgi:hypothetical protein